MPTDWGKIATTVAPLVIGAYAGHKSKQSANKSSAGARLQDLLPQMQALLATHQQHSAQNYGQQQSQYALVQPLMASIAQNAMRLMPQGSQQAMTMPQMAAGPSAPSALPMPSIADMESGYQRRGGGTGGAFKGAAGGVMTGATMGSVVPGLGTGIGAGVGALYGGIKGAVTKHAASAPSDFTVQDAHQILTRAYTSAFGRPPDPQEIESAIRGQGWQPGDRYVGQQGLESVIRTWQQQAGR